MSAGESAGCFLCNKESDRVVLREEGLEGRLCECRMVYTHPRPAPGTVDPTEVLHHEDFYSLSTETKARWMHKHCPPGRLLEVGCGTGDFLVAARELGFEVTGLEPHHARAQHARRVHNIDVYEAYLENNQLPRRHFDVVYHCDMLAHFADPIGALRSMVDLLRPGGVLCFEAGTLGGVSPLWYRLIGVVGISRHLWLYSRQSLELLFAQSQLSVIHRRRFGLAPEVLGMKAIGISLALARRGLRLVGSPRLTPSRSEVGIDARPRLDRQLHRIEAFFRYRVGALAPALGPQTMFFVVRPHGGS